MKNKNLVNLLQGKILIKEFNEGDADYRSWIELSLQDYLKPGYPFRTEPGAMLGGSSYLNSRNEFDAKFKLRVSYFLAEDIENELEPSYDRVGVYIYIDSMDKLIEQLLKYGVELESFDDVNNVDDYPL